MAEGIRPYKVRAVHESHATGFVLCNSGQFGGRIQEIGRKLYTLMDINIHSCLYVVSFAVL